MPVQFKFEASTNNSMNAANDQAIKNRGCQIEMTSRFVDKDEDVDMGKHIYKKNHKLYDLIRKPEYSLALFHIFAPFAKEFYAKGLNLPQKCKAIFAQNLEDMDERHDLFESVFELSDGSMVSKRVVMKCLVDDLSGRIFHNFRNIKDYCAKRGIKYESQKKYQGDKGVFLGIALK